MILYTQDFREMQKILKMKRIKNNPKFREFGGAVYYFKNSAVGLNPKEPPIILRGGGPESRFGFAISSAGDVNADGFVDVVIGTIQNPNY